MALTTATIIITAIIGLSSNTANKKSPPVMGEPCSIIWARLIKQSVANEVNFKGKGGFEGKNDVFIMLLYNKVSV